MAARKSANGKIGGAIVVIAVVVLAAWWYFSHVPGVDFSRSGPAPSVPATASTTPAPIEHPISEAQTSPAPTSTAALPALGASDTAAASSLAALPGADGLAGLLLSQALIPHIVATVDALPRHSIGVSILPVRTPQGVFTVDTSTGQPLLDPKDYARYAPYMRIIDALDSRTLVTWYVHWYPLFQAAYRQLGYPQGYFNDRLIQAIDNLLAAPNVQTPPALVAMADGHYAFADPTWESLSVGQKLMIRVGPHNERTLKIKLNSIRTLLLGKAPDFRLNAGPAPASTTP